jgi:hypothetical protein
MTGPNRIRKLLGMLALTYSWTRIIGIDRKAKEGAPRECANGYPEKVFSGMDWTASESLRPTGIGCERNYTGAFRHSSLLAHFCRVASE